MELNNLDTSKAIVRKVLSAPPKPTTYSCADSALPAGLAEEWEQFFESEDSRLAGEDIYTDIFSNGLLFPLQRMRETAEMMQRARRIKPRVIMEIGADKGGSFYHWIKSQPSVKKAIALEIRGTPYAQSFRRAFPDVDFLFLPTASLDAWALREVRGFLAGDALDCLFLDGDKGSFDRDFYAYLGFTRPSSLVFLHDVFGTAPPAKVFEELKPHFPTELILNTTETEEAARRASGGEAITSSYEGWLRVWTHPTCGVGIVNV
jgi:predicted O-methyltransferase YrrM